MLVADPEEADRIYLELKERAIRKKRLEAKEKKLSAAIADEEEPDIELEDCEEWDGESRDSRSSEGDRKSQQANKILNILEKMTVTEKLDFTNGLINFVSDKIDRKNIDALLPALKLLSSDQTEIRKSLLNQLKSLVELVLGKFGDESYKRVVDSIFPLLDLLLYD